jgi:hypothetical protein
MSHKMKVCCNAPDYTMCCKVTVHPSFLCTKHRKEFSGTIFDARERMANSLRLTLGLKPINLV